MVPVAGGRIDFEIHLVNNSDSPINFDFWTDIEYPDGTMMGPIIGPVSLTFPANANVQRERTQFIPGTAPVGIYHYYAYGGAYPDSIIDDDTFTFAKIPFGDGAWISDWVTTGEGFDEYVLTAKESPNIPKQFSLEQNYPNPFNNNTKFSYILPEAGQINLSVYNLNGRKISVLVCGFRSAGYHTVTFNASDLSSGIYFYRLETGTYSEIKKMVLIK